MALTKVQSEMAGAGQVLQVVNASTNTTVTSSSSSFADTTLTATITPKFATSKILILVSQNSLYKSATNTYMGLILVRNSTNILTFENQAVYNGSTNQQSASSSCNYLDSPATTSATTYKTIYNNVAGGTVSCQSGAERSTITLLEIAG